ncbi:unnamed protein product [Cuscuta epithymum]|uniref:Uncharacterized protein n=1 Tax=Cuscuta epithymum TaxID=186058 RepID=A0AAV0DQH6_9ASTE|nr:unnamed protein product [Cuscuta epithymum]
MIAASNPPPGQGAELAWPQDHVQFSITKGTAIMHGTLNPREFLTGATPPTDKSVLSRLKDDALGSKVLQASVTAALGLGELLKRFEGAQAQKKQADEALADSRRQLLEVRETLRLEQEAFDKILQDSKTVARAEGRADAEKATAAAAKAAAEAAEAARREAVAEAAKEAVEAFKSGGWRTEDHKEWMASVLPETVEEWVAGPGALWLARKGKSYYEGGEYFTQANIYRKLSRHYGTDLKDFKPEAYGLPPLQPDVRVPLPEGEERELLEDSELAKEAEDDEDEGAGDDAASKAKEDVAEEAHS